ncbi:hypothetical protein [Kangiella sp. HZ709]|uniref:hypothetical protein n=1 Tax=Kangiella sp. HZ709 TaxID=2666328 RepID=UPI0012B0256B|nr:hypothetical protein [Kangiella sp. HZ709]MRX27282.1 hypothetical protein [Kangiella sp. HZ709]
MINIIQAELDISNKLKKAMETSCDDALYFSDDETNLIDAEYLLTVNSAKAIQELNQGFGVPYKIRLEDNTKRFATACTPILGKKPADNFMGFKSVARCQNDTRRPGKIDIAIYIDSNGFDQAFCPIEVKGFNANKREIVKDLQRNADYFNLSSPTGKSELPFAFFVALHSYQKVWSDSKEAKNIEKVERKYEGYIAEDDELKKLCHKIDVTTIRRGSLPEQDDPYIQQFGLNGDEDYHFIGVIVVTQKCEST